MASHLQAMELVRAAQFSVSLAIIFQAQLYRDVQIFVSDPVHMSLSEKYLVKILLQIYIGQEYILTFEKIFVSSTPFTKKIFIHYLLVPGRQVPFLVRGGCSPPRPYREIAYGKKQFIRLWLHKLLLEGAKIIDYCYLTLLQNVHKQIRRRNIYWAPQKSSLDPVLTGSCHNLKWLIVKISIPKNIRDPL